ncbi:MAG: (Fe-S)-binding protein, partial [Opitutaceae bacterium]|nr:(Fe-S)-binding protein [Opitutaceae bacterium]
MSTPTAKSPDANPPRAGQTPSHLARLDYSILQQCMHCGMCLPTCPTYDATRHERHSPRGRIALMRAIADGKLTATATFGDEMYFCLGCLACQTACPAGVNYAQLFETARAEVERVHALTAPQRTFWRATVVKFLFTRPRLLRLFGRALWLWQATGGQWLFRKLRLNNLLPPNLRRLEPQAPSIRKKFSHQLIRPVERPDKRGAGVPPAMWHGHPAHEEARASLPVDGEAAGLRGTGFQPVDVAPPLRRGTGFQPVDVASPLRRGAGVPPASGLPPPSPPPPSPPPPRRV